MRRIDHRRCGVTCAATVTLLGLLLGVAVPARSQPPIRVLHVHGSVTGPGGGALQSFQVLGGDAVVDVPAGARLRVLWSGKVVEVPGPFSGRIDGRLSPGAAPARGREDSGRGMGFVLEGLDEWLFGDDERVIAAGVRGMQPGIPAFLEPAAGRMALSLLPDPVPVKIHADLVRNGSVAVKSGGATRVLHVANGRTEALVPRGALRQPGADLVIESGSGAGRVLASWMFLPDERPLLAELDEVDRLLPERSWERRVARAMVFARRGCTAQAEMELEHREVLGVSGQVASRLADRPWRLLRLLVEPAWQAPGGSSLLGVREGTSVPSGAEVRIGFRVSRPARAWLFHREGGGPWNRLAAVELARPGSAERFDLRLDDHAGRESFVLVASVADRPEFAVPSIPESDLRERLRGVPLFDMEGGALGSQGGGLAAAWLSFEHVP